MKAVLATAILNKKRHRNQVWKLADGRVAVNGCQAVTAGRKLVLAGLVTMVDTSAHHVHIGNNWDGSSKYGSTYAAVVTVLPRLSEQPDEA